MAITAGTSPGAAAGRDPVDRAVRITTSDLITVQSFYRSRPDTSGRDDALDQQLWGFTADSSLPISDARAQLEYSLWVPPGGVEDGFGDENNRLVRLRLNDQRRFFDYGANFFAVGEAFASNALARERLDTLGLPGIGSGSEFWVTGRLPGVGVKPRFRRLEKTQGNANLLNETFGLTSGHGLLGTRLTYLLESSRSSTWYEEAAAPAHTRDAAVATVSMQAADWNLYFKNLRFDEQFEAGRLETGSVWEMGGRFDLIRGLTLTPLLTDSLRDVGALDCLHATTARLAFHTTWLEPVDVNLQVQRHWRDTLDGNTIEDLAADLKLRTPLKLWERIPHSLVVTASVGYRGLQGVAAPLPEEGVSFRLTLDFQPGG